MELQRRLKRGINGQQLGGPLGGGHGGCRPEHGRGVPAGVSPPRKSICLEFCGRGETTIGSRASAGYRARRGQQDSAERVQGAVGHVAEVEGAPALHGY